MGWVSFVTRPIKSAFFEFFSTRGGDRPTPGSPCITPPVQPCSHPAHRAGLHSAGRTRYQGRPRMPGRWKRCAGLRSIPDRPRRENRDNIVADMLRAQQFRMFVRLILFYCADAASTTWPTSTEVVTVPTPPGTGVTASTMGSASSKRTSPQSLPSSLTWMPTSTTT